LGIGKVRRLGGVSVLKGEKGGCEKGASGGKTAGATEVKREKKKPLFSVILMTKKKRVLKGEKPIRSENQSQEK